MNLSVQKKMLIPLSLFVIIVISVSTYFFIKDYRTSIEKQLIARGYALTYALSHFAKEGLVQEDLDLLKKARYVIEADDVRFVQVYSSLWDVVDSFPFEKYSDPPHPEAIEHFKKESTLTVKKYNDAYHFYFPISYSPSADYTPARIGFVKLTLATAGIQSEIRHVVTTYVFIAAIITVITIGSLGYLITRIVTSRVKIFQENISAFKSGAVQQPVHKREFQFFRDELNDVFDEFDRMSSDIKAKESRLIEAKERVDSLFERVEHAIFRTDAEGKIIETNRKFDDLFGPVGRICALLNNVDCIAKASVEKKYRSEFRVAGRSGGDIYISLALYAETDEKGDIRGFDGYIMDISQQKKLEEVLLHRQKMEAIGTLAGGVAHDFNNILTAIISYANILLIKLGKEDALKHYIEQIMSASNKAANLTRNLLAFSRKQIIHPRPVDLNMIIRNLEDLLARIIGEDIELRISLSDSSLTVTADSSQIEQVLMNLAVNARDAMPHGGLLAIETGSFFIGTEDLNSYDVEVPGYYAHVSVSDTGTGMDEKTREKIFEPFFTTKEFGKGTGLGLSIIYGVIKQHNGNIHVYSEPGKGTKFRIYLPMQGMAKTELGRESLTVPRRGTETILMAEDDVSVRNATNEILANAGYHVIEAKNGEDAVRMVAENPDRIQLILLDVVMPKKNGRDTFEEIRKMLPGIKAIFMSGYAQDIMSMNDVLDDGVEFIQKPFAPGVLIEKVRHLLDKRRS